MRSSTTGPLWRLTPDQLYSVAGTTLHTTLCKVIVIHFDRILFIESRQLLGIVGTHKSSLWYEHWFVEVPREQMYSRLSNSNSCTLDGTDTSHCVQVESDSVNVRIFLFPCYNSNVTLIVICFGLMEFVHISFLRSDIWHYLTLIWFAFPGSVRYRGALVMVLIFSLVSVVIKNNNLFLINRYFFN